VARVANPTAFESPPAAARFVLVGSRSAAARRLLRPCDPSAGRVSRCDGAYGGGHPK
jgi:hypothetical protein